METNDVWGLQAALDKRLKEDDPRLVAALQEKSPTDHGHLAATPDTAGFMSAADKQKLEGLNQAFISSVQGLSAALDTKAPKIHTHPIDEVTELLAALEQMATSPQSSTIDSITGLQAALAEKAPAVHNHSISQILNLQNVLDSKAPKSAVYNNSPGVLTYTLSQSSVYQNTTAGTFAALTDGSLTTGAATVQGANQWMKADLGGVKYFNQITLSGGTLPNWGNVAFYLNGHSIEISIDNSNWLILMPSISLISDTEPTTFVFGAVAARYVRIRTRTNNYLAACEFKILG